MKIFSEDRYHTLFSLHTLVQKQHNWWVNDKPQGADRYKTHFDKQVFVQRWYHVGVKSTNNGAILCKDGIYSLPLTSCMSGLTPLHPSASSCSCPLGSEDWIQEGLHTLGSGTPYTAQPLLAQSPWWQPEGWITGVLTESNCIFKGPWASPLGKRGRESAIVSSLSTTEETERKAKPCFPSEQLRAPQRRHWGVPSSYAVGMGRGDTERRVLGNH